MLKLFLTLSLFAAPLTKRRVDLPKFQGNIPSVRIKDVAHFEGVRENALVGYGLVVGLNGTGDTFGTTPHTKESLTSMLERLGVNIRGLNLSGQNVAAVMVTAQLPAFARQGSRVDVTVSAVGNAKDLKGGTLLVTPLMAADGEVYVVAQGPVSTNYMQASGKNASIAKGSVPTSGKIANGGIVEKQVNFELNSLSSMTISLNNPDFTTAQRMAEAINKHFGRRLASALDSGSVKLHNLPRNPVPFLTNIEQLSFQPDQIARVVIDEQNGVIVMGHRVKIMPLAINHGTITIRIYEQPVVSQPTGSFLNAGETVTDKETDIDIQESKGGFTILDSGLYLDEFVSALNLLGVSPRDMVAILETIKASGGLQADLVFV